MMLPPGRASPWPGYRGLGGPDERFGLFVVPGDVALDGRHQLRHTMTMVVLSGGPHRDTITFIPYGDTNFALSTFVGEAASSTTDLPRKASRIVSTVWNGTRESAFT